MQTIVKIDFFAQPATKELLILTIASSFLGVKTTYLDFWSLKNLLNFWIQMELFSTNICRRENFVNIDKCFTMSNFMGSFQTSAKYKETWFILLQNYFKSASDPSSASNHFVQNTRFCVHQTEMTKKCGGDKYSSAVPFRNFRKVRIQKSLNLLLNF